MAAGAPPADRGVHGQQVMPTIILNSKIQRSIKKTVKSIQNPSWIFFLGILKGVKIGLCCRVPFLLVLGILGSSP